MICPKCGKQNSKRNKTCKFCNFNDLVDKIDDVPFFWYSKGRECYFNGKISNAIEYFNLSIKNRPTFDDAWNALGICHFKQKKIQFALECFDRAIFLNRTNEKAKQNKDYVLSKSSDFFTKSDPIIFSNYNDFLAAFVPLIQNQEDPFVVFEEKFWVDKTKKNNLNLNFFSRYLEQKTGKVKTWRQINNKLILLSEFKFLAQSREKNELFQKVIISYYSGKNEQFKGILYPICQRLLSDFEIEALPGIRSNIQSEIRELDQIKGKITDIEKLRSLRLYSSKFRCTLELLSDLEQIQKILSRKSIDLSILTILTQLHDICEDEFVDKIKETCKPLIEEIKRDLDIPSTPPEQIIKYIINWHLVNHLDPEISEIIYRSIFIELGYEIETTHIVEIHNQNLPKILEDFELNLFERNLGIRKVKNIDFDFEFLTDGFQFERLLEKLFEYQGYEVILTPKTGDQGADLIIIKDDVKTIIQAKYYSGNVGNGAIQQVVAAKKFYNADKARVITNSSFTQSAIELAEANDVELWDGQILLRYIKDLGIMTFNDKTEEKEINFREKF